MSEISWSAPEHPVDAGTARRGILAQHVHLRDLLRRAQALAEARLDGDTSVPDAVVSAIGDVRAAMEVHLTFEEAVLVPLFRDDLPLGPERAERLIDEHLRQRAMLAALHKEACHHPELPTLAAKLATMAAWLLADMDQEERSVLNPDTLRDDIVVVDQTCG
ncbi:MAG TPA: hemerythrin domain-containing protein [Polyangia bacterium]|nr:hemerythrin domain-containing protein [Polyangia bacterium]